MIVKIPVTWEMCGYIERDVDADDIKTAVTKAVKDFEENKDELPLPRDQYYVDGSFGMSCDADELEVYQ